ncbi:MAG: YitT family protein [Clostridiales bacterium]|jgi:uncharacterized membrane-anchored protein YitT (DUF2179 family)|nr:YitT family protein [Clostridiales bacterium]
MNRKKIYTDVLQMVAGNIICAFALGCFALPFNMVVSGMSGIGRMVNFYTGISVSMVVGVCNFALFIIGWVMLGKKFAASVAIGTFVYPTFLGIFQNIEPLQHLVDDPLLAAICAGILNGIGLGLVIRVGGSTGGTDIPPIILNRKFGWKVAPMLYALDVVVFIIQIPVTKTNGVILGILYALIYSIVMNKLIVMEQGGIQLMIFSEKVQEVNEKLLSMHFGTTLLNGTGGYMHEDKQVIYCAASSRNLSRIKRAVLAIDEKAFITITSMSEINGNGFTWYFRHEEYEPAFQDRHDGHEEGDSIAKL